MTNRLQNAQSIQSWHMHIEQRQMNSAMLDDLKRLDAIRSEQGLVASSSESFAERLTKVDVIIGDEEAVIGQLHGNRNGYDMNTVARTPRPGNYRLLCLSNQTRFPNPAELSHP